MCITYTPSQTYTKICSAPSWRESEERRMEAALGLMRRMPPKRMETALSALLSLLPDHSSDLLSQVDQPLQVSFSFDRNLRMRLHVYRCFTNFLILSFDWSIDVDTRNFIPLIWYLEWDFSVTLNKFSWKIARFLGDLAQFTEILLYTFVIMVNLDSLYLSSSLYLNLGFLV